MEEDIGKDSSDNRGETVKEMQDPFMAQQVEQYERIDPRDGNDIEPEIVDEVMSDLKNN